MLAGELGVRCIWSKCYINKEEKNMELGKELFSNAKTVIYNIDYEGNEKSYLKWQIAPLDAPILTSEYAEPHVYGKHINGFFLVKGKIIIAKNTLIDCFIEIAMPERIRGECFYKQGRKIVRKKVSEIKGEVISTVAIEGHSDYHLFYSKINPAIGIDALFYGLNLSKRKHLVSVDLAYILRDEGRFQESINAFSILINHTKENCYYFSERARLYEKIGDVQAAELDWAFIEKKWGKEFVSYCRTG
jgi:tetratricopeptide (TPR) repeat protein